MKIVVAQGLFLLKGFELVLEFGYAIFLFFDDRLLGFVECYLGLEAFFQPTVLYLEFGNCSFHRVCFVVFGEQLKGVFDAAAAATLFFGETMVVGLLFGSGSFLESTPPAFGG